MPERRLVGIEGTVQGVGFRPFVHTLARTLGLRGFVRNEAGRVLVEVEGDPPALAEFIERVAADLPPPAAIQRMRVRRGRARGYSEFRIGDSVEPASGLDRGAVHDPSGARVVAPDIGTCEHCVAELFDRADRRFRYPFISCSRCGPRLTILLAAPYDRARTTMRAFEPCAACRREYEDPADRRFHAQTNACPACGPQLWLSSLSSPPHGGRVPLRGERALAAAGEALRAGAIVAVKGLGGYHLACDATDADAVARLRLRKGRGAKPFAIMASDLGMTRTFAAPSARECEMLRSAARPITLVQRVGAAVRAADVDSPLVPAKNVAPGSPLLGVMLAYTPLHHLLLHDAGRPLVMTSGNRGEEPIATDDADARSRLTGIADCILGHDRAIAVRCDDSVVRVIGGTGVPLRRSRGLLPGAIELPVRAARAVLGVGGQLKSSICVAAGGWAHLSPHVGDLESAAAVEALRETIAGQLALLGVAPGVIAHDLHPDYASTRLAEALASAGEDALPLAKGVKCVAVQHHHAHVASCMAEHGLCEPVLGVVFDGAGLGTDGATWGGEFLLVDGAEFTRVAHLAYVPLPGGDAAAREPWRMAAAHLWSAYGGDLEHVAPASLDLPRRAGWPLLRQMLERGVRTPPTSSVGRLFDAVAALTGLRSSSRFEGDAAMALEAAADPLTRRVHPIDLVNEGGRIVLDCAPLIRGLVGDIRAGTTQAAVAGAFHESLAAAIARVAERVREQAGISRVALTGGVFQNALLSVRAAALLERAGFAVLQHRRVPCNDGALALGQAFVAAQAGEAGASPPAARDVQMIEPLHSLQR